MNFKIEILKRKLSHLIESGQAVIVTSKSSGVGETQSVYIDYVGDRWAKGHTIVYSKDGSASNIPYTINYPSVIAKDSSSAKVQLTFPDSIL